VFLELWLSQYDVIDARRDAAAEAAAMAVPGYGMPLGAARV
jgi:hypothetical protein